MEFSEFKPEMYDEIARWWSAHGWHSVHQDFLSKTGIVVTDNGVLRAAIWLYRTDSPLIMAEWLVTNPDNTPRQSYEAVSLLLDGIKDITIASDGYLMTLLQNKSLIKIFQKKGFTAEEKSNVILHFQGG